MLRFFICPARVWVIRYCVTAVLDLFVLFYEGFTLLLFIMLFTINGNIESCLHVVLVEVLMKAHSGLKYDV